jgi:hypothetical protein
MSPLSLRSLKFRYQQHVAQRYGSTARRSPSAQPPLVECWQSDPEIPDSRPVPPRSGRGNSRDFPDPDWAGIRNWAGIGIIFGILPRFPIWPGFREMIPEIGGSRWPGWGESGFPKSRFGGDRDNPPRCRRGPRGFRRGPATEWARSHRHGACHCSM